MGFGSIFKNFGKALNRSPKLKKRKYDPEALGIEDLKLPVCFNEIGPIRLGNDLRTELKDYKTLDYKYANLAKLKEKEYHSFQIGLMLKGIQDGYALFAPDKKEVFPDFILKYHSKLLELKIMDIIEKYIKEVDRWASENMLKEDYKWTPMDATHLLYYLSVYKEDG